MVEKTFDWKAQYAPWIILGVLFIVVNYFVVTTAAIDFPFGIVYAFSAFVVGAMLYLEKFNSWGMLLGAIVGCLPVIVSTGAIDASTGMWIAIVGLFVVWYLNHQESFGQYVENAKYLALVPMVIWLVWALLYIQQRMTDPTLLPFQTLIYHGAILIFAGWSILRFLDIIKDKDQAAKISMYLIIAALIGMFLVTSELGWGLQHYMTQMHAWASRIFIM